MASRPKPGSSERMTQLVDLAMREEQEAGARLREQRAELEKMTEELTLLRQYKAEYVETSAGNKNSHHENSHHENSHHENKGISVVQLRNLQQFLKTLDEAAELKTTQMQSQQDEVERARLRWLETYQRTDALTRVRDGRKQLEVLEQIKRDQAADEELVSSRFGSTGIDS